MRKKILIIAVILILIAALTTILLYYKNNSPKANVNINKEENITGNKKDKLENVEPIVIKINENIYCEILPEMELISGVMSQTKWIKDMAAEKSENIYFNKIQEFFSKYSLHKAVNLTNELINDYGFGYTVPLEFMLSLGKLPNLDKIHEYPSNVIESAGGEQKIENYRLALIQIAEESNFMQFFEDNRENLKKYLEDSLKLGDLEKAIEWNNKFYGKSPASEYRLVFIPAYFPRGGYGPPGPKKSDGSTIFYQFLTNSNNGTNIPSLGTKRSIMYMALHEWGHSYSNPILEKFVGDLEKHEFNKFIEPVKERLTEVGYSDDVEIFFYEQVLRGCIITAMRELCSEDDVNYILNIEKKNGFYLTEFTAEIFKEYTSNREKYKTYEDFIPYLLDKYYENREELLKLAEDSSKNN